jgi:hypothetical protein
LAAIQYASTWTIAPMAIASRSAGRLCPDVRD